MSDRNKDARDKLNKKLINRKITTNSNDLMKKQAELKEIQSDFEDGMIPISFLIINYENIYFVKPSTTIDEMLSSESLIQRVNKQCEEVGIDPKLLDTPTTIPVTNNSYTIDQWLNTNGKDSIHILFKYKTDLRDRQIGQQKKEDVVQSASPNLNEQVDIISGNSEKQHQQQKIKIDEQTSKIDHLLECINRINNTIKQQDLKIGQQDLKIEEQNAEIKSLKFNVHSLCIQLKPLANLNKRILIEKFRLYLARKYSDLFVNLTGISVNDETKYRDIYQFMSTFLNELHQGASSSLVKSIEEKQCLQQALGHIGSYYQTTSDKFIHEATKENIAESVLRNDTANKNLWINMYKFVYGEEPSFIDISSDTSSIPDDPIE